jgi:hypothetical protein
MNTRDLFEMASLDVMGLLDEQERSAFEEAFRAAPPHIQAQIRAEQTRATDLAAVLPDVEAPVGLRSKVLSGIHEAITAVQNGPVASIGPGGRLSMATPIWRAACIGFATASLVLAGFSWKVTQDNKSMVGMALSNSLSADLAKKAGPGLTSMLTKPTLRHVSFSPTAPDAAGRAAAALFFDASSKTAYLICDSLPQIDGDYRLVVQGKAGTAVVSQFRAGTGNFFVPIPEFDSEGLESMRIQAPSADGSSTPLLVTSGV